MTGCGLRVMVVDDCDAVRDVILEMLEHLGFEGIGCSAGREAVELYGRYWQDISFVILDIRLQDLNGREVFSMLRRINPDVKVLFISGAQNSDENEMKVPFHGAAGFIAKPFRLDAISREMCRLTGGKGWK